MIRHVGSSNRITNSLVCVPLNIFFISILAFSRRIQRRQQALRDMKRGMFKERSCSVLRLDLERLQHSAQRSVINVRLILRRDANQVEEIAVAQHRGVDGHDFRAARHI